MKDEEGGRCSPCACGPPTIKLERGAVLRKALDLINGERRTVYGAPEMSFPKIAALWSAYLNARFNIDIELTAKDIALIMTLYKIAREVNGYKDDNWVDMAGYIGLGGDLADE